MSLLLVRNDIVNVQADAIVNPANPQLVQGSGTSRAIYLAAGEEKLAAACAHIGHCGLGEAVITPAFQLPAKYIIHAACPAWEDGTQGEAELLKHTYTSALLLAAKYQLESIAFPLLSAGNYRFPKEVAMQTAVNAISSFLMEHEMTVYLVLYDRSSVSVSKKLFAEISEYIDDHYVTAKDERYPGAQRGRRMEALWEEQRLRARMEEEQQRLRARVEEESSFGDTADEEQTFRSSLPAPKKSLEERMRQMQESFSQMLLRLIDERGLSDSYVYKRANVDRRHFSKIRNDVEYCPSKKTVLAFAVALELTLEETGNLLQSAGFMLSNSSKFDVIVRYFIESRIYDIYEINAMLFAYGQPILC